MKFSSKCAEKGIIKYWIFPAQCNDWLFVWRAEVDRGEGEKKNRQKAKICH